MKTTDLMIGDWVNIFNNPKQIEGVRKFSNGDEMVYYDGDNGNFITAVTPIPLTSEILEKNGFIRVLSASGKLCGWYFENDLIDKYYVVDVTYNNDRLWVEIHGSTVIEKYCDYVHELQHALNLCNIENEIIL